LNHAHKTGQEL